MKQSAEAENSPLISNETLLALYRDLLRSRLKDGRRTGRGRHAAEYEATVAGVSMGLRPDDWVRSSGETDADLLHSAMGAALANKTSKTRRVVVIFGRDGTAEPWQIAIESARVHLLPMILVSVSDEANGQPPKREKKSSPAPGTELPHITVDGNDVVAVYRVAHEAIERARRDRGPTLIECTEYRLSGQDPIRHMEDYLRGRGLLRPGLKREILGELTNSTTR